MLGLPRDVERAEGCGRPGEPDPKQPLPPSWVVARHREHVNREPRPLLCEIPEGPMRCQQTRPNRVVMRACLYTTALFACACQPIDYTVLMHYSEVAVCSDLQGVPHNFTGALVIFELNDIVNQGPGRRTSGGDRAGSCSTRAQATFRRPDLHPPLAGSFCPTLREQDRTRSSTSSSMSHWTICRTATTVSTINRARARAWSRWKTLTLSGNSSTLRVVRPWSSRCDAAPVTRSQPRKTCRWRRTLRAVSSASRVAMTTWPSCGAEPGHPPIKAGGVRRSARRSAHL